MLRRDGKRWVVLPDRVQRLWSGSRRKHRARQIRLRWQTCRRCLSKSYLPADQLCGGCRSPRAAMIYQNATTIEDRAIADRLSGLVDAHRNESEDTDRADDSAKDDDSDYGSVGVHVSVS